jgi:hypothetical protein
MLDESSFPRNVNHVNKIHFITFSNIYSFQTSLHFTKVFRSKRATILLENDVYILFAYAKYRNEQEAEIVKNANLTILNY